jgi:GntP family gluconate:H+ symporter
MIHNSLLLPSQKIINALSPIVAPSTLNIFNAEGIILASSDIERIGSFHSGALKAATLIPKSARPNKLAWVTKGVTNSAGILAITGAGGAFGAILKTLPIAEVLSTSLLTLNIGVFLLFIIAALLKSAMGASTVAMIVTSAMIAPLMTTLGFDNEIAKVLVIMAIGAGSITVSHSNDSYFWVVSQFSDMNVKQAFKCQTGVTAVMGISTILMVFVISLFVM